MNHVKQGRYVVCNLLKLILESTFPAFCVNCALVNEAGEEQSLKAKDSILVDPDEKHKYRNMGDKPFKMICVVLKKFE